VNRRPGTTRRRPARDRQAQFRALSRTGPTDVPLLTDRHAGNVLSGERRPWWAARWVTVQVGRNGRSVADVVHFERDWRTVMDAVVLFGQVLIDDPNASVPSSRSGWTTHCLTAKATTAPSAGRPRSSMCNTVNSAASWSAC